MTRHAVVTRGHGGAIVTAEAGDDGGQIITAIERFPYEAGPVVDRALHLKADDPTCSIVVDVEGLGDAVWELLARPRRRHGWLLYAKHGLEREELTRTLLVAVERNSFRFAPGLADEDAMKRALVGLTRNVREEGPGSELAVALSLALDDHRPPTPRIG
ncbi:MAG: hypothetical protein WEE67_04530 [Chloroflexota bacterium]